jgi:hypothetical protein
MQMSPDVLSFIGGRRAEGIVEHGTFTKPQTEAYGSSFLPYTNVCAW